MADQLPPDHPARVAWDGIRRTDYFEHMAEQGARVVAIRGTLWAAFAWGWNAALGRPPFGAIGPRALLSPNLFVAVPGDPDSAKYAISVGKLAEVIGVARADLAAWIAYHATPLSVDEVRAGLVDAGIDVRDSERLGVPVPLYQGAILPGGAELRIDVDSLVGSIVQAIIGRDAVRDTGHDRDGGRARSRVAGAARVRLLIDEAIARMAACSGNVLTLKLEPTGWRVWGASYATANNSPTAAVQTAAAVERWAAELSSPLPTGSGEFDREAAAIAADLDLEGEGEP